jgi:hypothetical protein
MKINNNSAGGRSVLPGSGGALFQQWKSGQTFPEGRPFHRPFFKTAYNLQKGSNMAFSRPTLAEIIARMDANASRLVLSSRSVAPFSFVGGSIRAFACAVYLFYCLLKWAIDKRIIHTAYKTVWIVRGAFRLSAFLARRLGVLRFGAFMAGVMVGAVVRGLRKIFWFN